MLHPLMLLGMRGSADRRALPPGRREPVRQGVVLRDALHVVAVMVVVGWGGRLLLLVPSDIDSSSSTVAVAILGVQCLELGRSPSHTSSPSKSSRVRLAEVGRWGGAWGRGGWGGDDIIRGLGGPCGVGDVIVRGPGTLPLRLPKKFPSRPPPVGPPPPAIPPAPPTPPPLTSGEVVIPPWL